MKELIGLAIIGYLFFKYFQYLQALEEYRRSKRYPSATKRPAKPNFLNIKK